MQHGRVVPGVGWVDTDYLGKKRSEKNPFPGPFPKPDEDGKRILKVWPAAPNAE